MPVADLVKNASLVPKSLIGDGRTVTVDFIRRRVRRLIAADASIADPARKGDITKAATPGVATQLGKDITAVQAAHDTISKRVQADTTQLPLDLADIRKRVFDRTPTDNPTLMRKRLVLSIVYQAAAADMTLADPANIERLHEIFDRRLRIVERMLYYVGRAGNYRKWSRSQVNGHKGGPWVDGLERAFEYPRVPQEIFLGPCSPQADGTCQAPMQIWHARGTENLVGPKRTNPTTTTSWVRSPDSDYKLFFTPGSLPDALTAIDDLFVPSTDYLSRNLLFCDHTIHALHLEALVYARRKRKAATNWLDGERSGKPAGWLRLYAPLVRDFKADALGNVLPLPFLAGPDEPAHFTVEQVAEADLQVGDHVIIYNHPAYINATIAGVWKLENAVVVQTQPELLMQGHGSQIYTREVAWSQMVTLFNRELDQRRADVEGLAQVTADGPKANQVSVDSASRLRRGMEIEIADPVTNAVIAGARHISAISGNVVTYDGADVTATGKHVIRRSRGPNGTGIDAEGVTIVRRVAPDASSFKGRHQRADWFLAWEADSKEDAVRQNAAQAAYVKSEQLVEYTVVTLSGTPTTIGWFPLWQAVSNKGGIVSTAPVTVAPKNIAGWTWFFGTGQKTDDLPVAAMRPRVP